MVILSPDNPLDGQWRWNQDTDDFIVNERWAEIQGLALGPDRRLSRKSWISRMHPEDKMVLEKHLAALSFQICDRLDYELRYRHGEGHWIWLLLRAQQSQEGSSGPRDTHGVLQDITTRKHLEALLREDHYFLGRSEQITGTGVWQVELDSRRVAWSDETCRIHGKLPGLELDFDEAMDYFTAPAKQAFRACVDQAVESGDVLDIELPLNRSDGKRIMVRYVGAVEYYNEEAIRLSGAIQDISERTARLLDKVSEDNVELERANERLSLATSSGGIGIWDLDVDTGHVIWDEHMASLYGLEGADEAPDCADSWLEYLHVEDRPHWHDIWQEARFADGKREFYFNITTAGGEKKELFATVRVIRDASGSAIRMVGTNQDVTEARDLAREIARQNEILDVTLHSIGDGVITTDLSGKVLWLNPVAEAMVGWSTEQAHGCPLTDVFNINSNDSRLAVCDPEDTRLDEHRIEALAGNHLLVSRDAEERWIENSVAPIRNGEGNLYGAVLVFRDVTEKRLIETEMKWRATHDPMTGLVNRAEFESILTRLLDGTREAGGSHALLFIDLDQFKIVNDSCGHAAGDLLLKEVSTMLEHSVRADDIVARIGGDEFAVILKSCDPEQALRMSRKICNQMDDYRFTHEKQRYRIGTSIGLVPVSDEWGDMSAIIQAADTACYAAKDAGRNRVHVWCETDSTMLLRRVQTSMVTRLEDALDHDGFELYAQRIHAMDAVQGGQSSAKGQAAMSLSADNNTEILLRLKAEGEHPILPGVFMPAAERFKLVNRIDGWVLTRIIAWLQSRGENEQVGTLWVNLSGQSFGDSSFQRDTLERLQSAGRDVCESLCFEITETAAVQNLVEAASFINDLHVLGVRIALDDFGAGASSFGYLKSLPVDFLKIDGQFVRNLKVDRMDAAAVRCFAEVAGIMGIQTVAEFVETPEVLTQLKRMGVDFAQGWLLHRPVPLAELFGDPVSGLHKAVAEHRVAVVSSDPQR